MLCIEKTRNVIDVTKAPYFADNTGKTDCTNALRKAIDDCLSGYITELEKMKRELLRMAKEQGGNVYLGAEAGRVLDGEVYITMPQNVPAVKQIYFPRGIYSVSNTITYTFPDLFAQQHKWYRCELCRNIHLIGEDMATTVIRLSDNAEGFGDGSAKPVISFNTKSRAETETTNCAHMNTLENLTVDCGCGNGGAIGVLYASSNCGRIENVTVKTQAGAYGFDFDYGSECCIENVCVSGFDFGMRIDNTSPIVMNGVDLTGNRIAGVTSKNGMVIARGVRSDGIPTFSLREGNNGRFYFADKSITYAGASKGNFVYYEDPTVCAKMPPFPKKESVCAPDDAVCVDDFGAIADGKTDCTVAIQTAMNSGSSVIVFGEGIYRIERTVKIPSSVKLVDLAYADLTVGRSILVGEMECVFDVCEDADTPLFIEHLSTREDFSGFFRFCRHSARRTLVLRDIFIAAALYFNTVSGSEVYIDNCFTHTNHYTQNVGLARDGYTPVFCRMIPVEAHGQRLYARNLNIERADLALLNDASEIVIDGYKIEGPSVLAKILSDSATEIHLFNAAWWGNKVKENGLFEVKNGTLSALGGYIFCYPEDEEYCRALTVTKRTTPKYASLMECSAELSGKDALGRPYGRMIVSLNHKFKCTKT